MTDRPHRDRDADDGLIDVGSADDPRLADYRLLNDHEARRTHEGDEFFIAEGYVAIDRVIDTGHELRSVVLTPSRVARFTHHLPLLAEAGVPVYVVERSLLERTVGFGLHRGVLASARRRPLPTVDELAASAACVAVLDGLNDPENVGAIARTARALGIDGLLLDPTCTDPYARRTVRVSMGEILGMRVARSPTPTVDALGALHRHGFETWAMTPDPDATDLWELAVPERMAVVLGAEGPGLDRSVLDSARRRVRIPIEPEVDSLNVGHAAAITFAIVRRRRGERPPTASGRAG